jgi:hypothetical protein
MTAFVTMEASSIAKVDVANGKYRVSKAAVGLTPTPTPTPNPHPNPQPHPHPNPNPNPNPHPNPNPNPNPNPSPSPSPNPRVSKAAVGLDECVGAFPRLGLESLLPTIQHWVQVCSLAFTP